jgi:SAM-dependent methyltransferase
MLESANPTEGETMASDSNPAAPATRGPLDAASWDARYEGRELLWSATPNRFVAEETAGLPPGRALDLAAGEGRNAVWLAEQGWAVTAVDFSPVGLAKARELAAHRGVQVEWVTADLAAWAPPPATFDLVVVAYLHAGADLLQRVLTSSAAALRPGGSVLVVGHDVDNLDRGHGGPPDPAVLYTVGDVVAALPGLEIVRAEQVHRTVELDDGGTATAVDTLVRAVRPAG